MAALIWDGYRKNHCDKGKHVAMSITLCPARQRVLRFTIKELFDNWILLMHLVYSYFPTGTSDKDQQQSTICHHSSVFKHNKADSREE